MDDVELIKSNIDIVDFIGKYLELKPAGANYKGLSPFHPERTASFIVSPSKNIWHDFSANTGGDIISFTQKIENVDFIEALEILANYAGIKLKKQKKNNSSLDNPKSKIYEILNLAKNFYQNNLIKNNLALEYLKTRNISKQSIIDFQIGFSSSEYSKLYDILSLKFPQNILLQSTLFKKNSRGNIYDFFRGRIMLPVNDFTGKVIGFSARQIVNDPGSGKYINSADNIIYNKTRALYGVFQAKAEISRLQQVVIVEGNLDCIKLHQIGRKNSVAISGTALTKPQLQILRPMITEIILGLDSDKAGIQATLKSLAIILDGSIRVSVLNYSDCKDIDEYIDKYGDKGANKLFETRLSVLEFLSRHFNQYGDLALNHWLNFLQTLDSELVVNQYLQHLVSIFNINIKVLESSIKKNKKTLDISVQSKDNKISRIDNYYIKLIALLNHSFDNKLNFKELETILENLSPSTILGKLITNKDFSVGAITKYLPELSPKILAEIILLEEKAPSLELTKKEIGAIIVEINKYFVNREISELKILISAEVASTKKEDLLVKLQDKLRNLKGS